jgi:acyl carrier protein
MSDLESRLQECFATVFPDIPACEITATMLDTTPQWDSVATVILVTVLEEQFAITIDPGDFHKLTSYRSIREYLRSRPQNAALGV